MTETAPPCLLIRSKPRVNSASALRNRVLGGSLHGLIAVILSYNLWHSTFHADPNLIGQAIQLKSEPDTVMGLLTAGARTPLDVSSR